MLPSEPRRLRELNRTTVPRANDDRGGAHSELTPTNAIRSDDDLQRSGLRPHDFTHAQRPQRRIARLPADYVGWPREPEPCVAPDKDRQCQERERAEPQPRRW